MEKFQKTNISENPQNKEGILYAPEGWKTGGTISTELNITRYTIENIVKQYRETNPEYFGEFSIKNGRECEYFSPELVKIIIEKSKEVESAPEGWKTAKKLQTELGRNKKATEKIIKPYRETNPEYFKELKPKSGSSKSEHYSPELIKIITDEFGKTPPAPEDGSWKTTKDIYRTFGISPYLAQNIANKYRETNPEYFKEFKIRGNIWEHFSPELIKTIIEKSQEVESAPEGWNFAKKIENMFGISQHILLKITSKYKKSNPEYFKKFKTNNGQILEHYSPELVNIINRDTKEIQEILDAPDGWKTNGNIAVELLNTNQKTISKIADEYRATNPEYFKEFKSIQGKKHEHYSPELVKIIVEEIQRLPIAPGGWKSTNELSEELDTTYGKIESIAEKHRQHNPEYFKDYRNKQNRILGYYSPELVEIISKENSENKKAPEGWETNSKLALKHGRSNLKISNIADRYRITNPEYFKEFKIDRGRLFEHYSPELVEIIKNELDYNSTKITEAPENWKTKEDLAQETGISIEDINRAAAKLRKEFPDKFGKFKNKE